MDFTGDKNSKKLPVAHSRGFNDNSSYFNQGVDTKIVGKSLKLVIFARNKANPVIVDA